MKTVLVDVYKIKNVNSGLGQFALNFANSLAQYASNDLELNCLVPNSNSVLLDKKLKPLQSTLLNKHFPNKNNFDLWHSLHQFPSHIPNSKTKQILTIHDLNFLIEKSGTKKEKYLNELQKNVDRADFITTISNHTLSEIEKHLDLKCKPVSVIYNGVSIDNSTDLKRPDFINDSKFFFSIGIFNRKKNFHSLIPLLKNFENTKLVLAGNNDTKYGQELKGIIKENGLEDNIILPGLISESDKNWLYQNTEALLFPSLAEGFGLPVIEAMQHGKPVFLSQEGSLPEVGGDLAFYFSDFEEKNMVSVIHKGLENLRSAPDKFSDMSIEYGNKFNWENSIKSYLNLYQEILDNQ